MDDLLGYSKAEWLSMMQAIDPSYSKDMLDSDWPGICEYVIQIARLSALHQWSGDTLH